MWLLHAARGLRRRRRSQSVRSVRREPGRWVVEPGGHVDRDVASERGRSRGSPHDGPHSPWVGGHRLGRVRGGAVLFERDARGYLQPPERRWDRGERREPRSAPGGAYRQHPHRQARGNGWGLRHGHRHLHRDALTPCVPLEREREPQGRRGRRDQRLIGAPLPPLALLAPLRFFPGGSTRSTEGGGLRAPTSCARTLRSRCTRPRTGRRRSWPHTR